MILTANCTYSGVTNIYGGTLQLGAGGTTTGVVAGPVYTGDLTNGTGTLVFNNGSPFSCSAYQISGSGGMTKLGANTVVLTGNTETYTGPTTIYGGTLSAGIGYANSLPS